MQNYVRLSQLATTPKKQGLLPISPATIWRKVANDEFPKPIKLGPKLTAWDVQEVESWLAAQKGAR
jgi:prophage regulatory protein